MKLLQQSQNILELCETRLVELKRATCVQLTNDEWVYFALHSDTVKSQWGEEELVDIQAANELWMKSFYHSRIVSIQLYCNE